MSEDAYIHGLTADEHASLCNYIQGHYRNARVVNQIGPETKAYIMAYLDDVPMDHIRAIRQYDLMCWRIVNTPAGGGDNDWRLQVLDGYERNALDARLTRYDNELKYADIRAHTPIPDQYGDF